MVLCKVHYKHLRGLTSSFPPSVVSISQSTFGKFKSPESMIIGIGFPISINLILNSVSAFTNLSVGQSGGWYKIIIAKNTFVYMYELISLNST